jgi:hypothetical protein
MPWTDVDGKKYRDWDQVVAPNGTTYPGSYPKGEISGLTWEADPPAPEPTKAEKQARVDSKIYGVENKQLRAVREAILGMPGATARLQAIENQIATLRAERAAL